MKNKTNHTTQEFTWKTPIKEQNHDRQGQQEKNITI